VIQRGNNRQPVFFQESDYNRYLHDLNEVAESVACLIHAYVLMTNHVHLLVTPMAPMGISHLMQGLGRRYVAYVNGTYGRTGTLWEGRYKAGLVEEDEYLLACMRYIELNPVRAGMVDHPGAYPWSSYRWNAMGLTEDVRLSSPAPYLALATGAERCRGAYRGLFDRALEPEKLDEIRDVTNSCLVLGNDRFKAQIAAVSGQRVEKGKAGRPGKKEIAV
jgi:putative transposase